MSSALSPLAESWVAYWREYDSTGNVPDDNDASEELRDLARTDPDVAWDAIIQILGLLEPKSENPLFQSLAAGPLEDLLGDNGPAVIDRLEAEARQNSHFNLLLGGVWKGRMSQDIWERVAKCRLSVW